MAAKKEDQKSTTKKSTSAKSKSGKSAPKKSAKKSSSPGILDKVKDVAGEILTSAAQGAAAGAYKCRG